MKGVGAVVLEAIPVPFHCCFYTFLNCSLAYIQRGDVVVESGPDVSSSCGAYGHRLHVGTSYVAGIGGICGPIAEWREVSTYIREELDLLRMLRYKTVWAQWKSFQGLPFSPPCSS